ncbi:MAG: SDR family oxidoreductase [Paracoccaceae bacterium]
MTFKDKTAIVTGASSGIGRAMALALAQLGCRVVVAARSQDDLEELSREIGDNALAVPTDVSNRMAVDHLIETTVQHFGAIDIVFANAGVFSQTAFIDVEEHAIDSMIDVNIRGVMHVVHSALPHMRARENSDILIVSSIAGVTELPLQAVYSPTKHALQSFAHILRRQVRNDGIRVGLINPGTVATPLWGDRSEEEIQAQIDQHETLRSEDVVETAMFMLSRPPHVAIRDVVILPQGQDI